MIVSYTNIGRILDATKKDGDIKFNTSSSAELKRFKSTADNIKKTTSKLSVSSSSSNDTAGEKKS